MPQLPALSSADLARVFHADPLGAQRYRVIQDILVRGLTQAQAAETHGISARSVRLYLARFNRGGLRALRSSAPTRSHRTATQRARQILAELLAERPYASLITYRREAHDRLCAEGLAVSRRTMYRLLAQLRRGTDFTGSASHRALLRHALRLLLEDPPLTLGRCTLAHELFPHESDARQRGTILKQVLHQAIQALRTAHLENDDWSRWGYQIVCGEYVDGEHRTVLEQRLAISRSTYTRVKRMALIRMIDKLPDLCRAHTAGSAVMRNEVTGHVRALHQAAGYLKEHSDRNANALAAELTTLRVMLETGYVNVLPGGLYSVPPVAARVSP
jgi:transposase